MDKEQIEEALRAGHELQLDAISDTEDHLSKNPDDEESRVKLVGYYERCDLDVTASAKLADHLAWFIMHSPGGALFEVVTLPGDPEAFRGLGSLWREKAANSSDTNVLNNAANFFRSIDPRNTELYWKQACRLEPWRTKWARQLAVLYQQGILLGQQDTQQRMTDAISYWSLALRLINDGDRDAFVELYGARMLFDLASWALDAGNHDEAYQIAMLLKEVKTTRREAIRDDGTRSILLLGSEAQHLSVALQGRLLIKRFQIADAIELMSGMIRTGVPIEPDLSFAQGLLNLGESSLVLQYLRACLNAFDSFIKSCPAQILRDKIERRRTEVEGWIEQIEAGIVANLTYSLY